MSLPLPRRDVEVVCQVVDRVEVSRGGFSYCCKRYAIVASPFLTPFSHPPHMFQSLVLHVVDNDFVYRTMKNSYNAFPQAP